MLLKLTKRQNNVAVRFVFAYAPDDLVDIRFTM